MRHAHASASNLISLSRIGLAFTFLFLFRSSYGPFQIAATIVAAVAQITDHLDGYLVRRLSRPNAWGWMCDSLADRAFYFAALLAFEREFALSALVVWLFTLREMSLYAVGAVSPRFDTAYAGLRRFSLMHASMVRLSIAFGCVIPFATTGDLSSHLLTNLLTVTIIVATALGYFNLWLLLRRLQ